MVEIVDNSENKHIEIKINKTIEDEYNIQYENINKCETFSISLDDNGISSHDVFFTFDKCNKNNRNIIDLKLR